MIGGSILGVYGLIRGSVTGWTLAALGAALFYRGYSGHCSMYEALGHSTAERARPSKRGHQRPESAEPEPEAASPVT
jgi:hypothetical protein